jgi:site-specific DNA recombinase
VKRCGLYTRVSTEDQVRVKDGSLDTQLDLLERHVQLKAESTDEPWHVAARYREEGKSGSNTNRPQFQRLLSDVRAGKLDVVLCTKFDRISRSVRDFLDFQESLKESGVAFVSMGEQWDTTTPMGEFALLLFLGVAQLERKQISARTSEKAEWRAQKGLKNGGQILGYDVDPANPGIPTVNEEEKQLVVLIYKTYMKGLGLLRTAETINRKGYRTKSYTSRRGKVHGGKPFSDTAISRILGNAFFIGKIRHKDELFDGQHEPIVSPELFESVQRQIGTRGGKRSRPQVRRLFLLDGLVRCGSCGGHMTPYFTYNHQKKQYAYYMCSNRNHRGKDACSMANVPADPLEKVIADRLIQLSQQDRTVDHLVDAAMADTSELLGNLTTRRTAVGTNRVRVTSQIDALVEGIAGRRTALKSVSKKIVELEEQKEQLDDEVLQIDLEIEATKQKAVSAQSLTESLTTFGELYREALPEERRELIRLRVNQLVWKPDEIRLALLDTPKAYQRLAESPQLVARTGFEPVLPA